MRHLKYLSQVSFWQILSGFFLTNFVHVSTHGISEIVRDQDTKLILMIDICIWLKMCLTALSCRTSLLVLTRSVKANKVFNKFRLYLQKSTVGYCTENTFKISDHIRFSVSVPETKNLFLNEIPKFTKTCTNFEEKDNNRWRYVYNVLLDDVISVVTGRTKKLTFCLWCVLHNLLENSFRLYFIFIFFFSRKIPFKKKPIHEDGRHFSC